MVVYCQLRNQDMIGFSSVTEFNPHQVEVQDHQSILQLLYYKAISHFAVYLTLIYCNAICPNHKNLRSKTLTGLDETKQV